MRKEVTWERVFEGILPFVVSISLFLMSIENVEGSLLDVPTAAMFFAKCVG